MLFYSLGTQKQIFGKSVDEIGQAMEPVMPTLNSLRGVRAKEVVTHIDCSRSWLGEPLFALFHRHYDILLGHLALLVENPRAASREELLEALNVSRQAILHYLTP